MAKLLKKLRFRIVLILDSSASDANKELSSVVRKKRELLNTNAFSRPKLQHEIETRRKFTDIPV